MQRTPRREHERAATADEAESESQRSTDVSEFTGSPFAVAEVDAAAHGGVGASPLGAHRDAAVERAEGRSPGVSAERVADRPAPVRRLFAELEAELGVLEPEPRSIAWRPLLAGSSPREILARIVPEDPLGVRGLVAARLRRQAFLLDADRVHLRALALCARWAPRYHGQPDIHTWLERLVDQSIIELVREEQEELARVEEPADAGAFHALAAPLGLDPRAVQLGCRAFNRLVPEERSAFFELVLCGRTLDEVARESGRPAVELARCARRALEVFVATAPRARGEDAGVRAKEYAARKPREGGAR